MARKSSKEYEPMTTRSRDLAQAHAAQMFNVLFGDANNMDYDALGKAHRPHDQAVPRATAMRQMRQGESRRQSAEHLAVMMEAMGVSKFSTLKQIRRMEYAVEEAATAAEGITDKAARVRAWEKVQAMADRLYARLEPYTKTLRDTAEEVGHEVVPDFAAAMLAEIQSDASGDDASGDDASDQPNDEGRDE